MNLRYIVLDENLLTRGSDGTYYRLSYRPDGEKERKENERMVLYSIPE